MKPLITFFSAIFCVLTFVCQAQTLEVSWDKTTVLIFDSRIQSIDRGSRLLLGQQDDQALNLLKLKAGSKELPETTLHVLTADGNLHEFQVQYAEAPVKTTWDFRKAEQAKSAQISQYDMDQTRMEHLASALANQKRKPLKKALRYAVEFELNGIYYQEGLLFFDFRLENFSAIPFEISGPDFLVVDTKGKKQASYREKQVSPWLSVVDQPIARQLEKKSVLLFAFPAFTIANNKKLLVQLSETHGDRELELQIRGRKLLRAKTLPMFHTKPTTAYGSGEL